MRNLIVIAILLGGGAYALATPGPQPTEPRAAGARTVAEAELIASLRRLADPVVELTEDAYAARPIAPRTPPAPAKAEVAETVAEAGEKLIVAADALNLRASPSTQAEVLGRLFKGEPVLATARENGWVQLAGADGTVGWAHGDFLVAAN